MTDIVSPAAPPVPHVAHTVYPSGDEKVQAAVAPTHATPAPLTRMIKLRLDSLPQGAEVVRVANGRRLGRTPLISEIIRSKSTEVFLFRLAGYREASLTLSIAQDNSGEVRLLPQVGPDTPAYKREFPARKPQASPSPLTDLPRKGPKIIDPFTH